MSSLPSTRLPAIPPARTSPDTGVGPQAMLRLLRPVIGQLAGGGGSAVPLERTALHAEPAQLAACSPLEDGPARPVSCATAPMVAAFLDGVQRSRVIAHLNGSPLVLATVAAAIRQRHDRRLTTWHQPLCRDLLLASRTAVGAEHWAQLEAAGVAPIDLDLPTDEDGAPPGAFGHPHAARARALAHVSRERETLERHLAARWCTAESRWLWIDGGIAGNLAFDADATAFGVVKSHTTLYGDAESVAHILTLRRGERSPAFLVGSRVRRAVASWYLRWHESPQGDPLFGLVRVEVVPPPPLLHTPRDRAAQRAFSTHCDMLSSAILLERRPLSLPDPRWHTLTYGVHDVEMYLQALIGP